MAQHLLIASATWHYKDPQDDRPILSEILKDVVDLFTNKLGVYTRELQEVGENPKASDLLAYLDQWFADPRRDPDDWIVFYYTGHAEIVGADSLYLLTTDFVDGRHASTAFNFTNFADIVLAPSAQGRTRRVRNLLVILDTCFAGQGVIDLSSQLAVAFRRSSGGSFYLLGSALSRQEALAGALAKALIAAIEDLSNRYVMQEFLYLDQLMPTINQFLRKAGIQDAMRSALDSPTDIPRFFPNRSYVDTNGKPVAVNEALRAISDQDFRNHWGPRARGVEFDNQPGFYFFGRREVLGELSSFLNDKTDNRPRIVTGSPGSGKSAILSRLVNISDPALREKLPSAEAEAKVPPFDLALHAKGKSLPDVISRFGQAFGVEATIEGILDALQKCGKPIRVVIDALDEAVDPARLSSEFLHPLAAVDSVKLLVGTRTDQLNAFPEAEIIDIDKPEFASKKDLADYVKARLLRRDEPGQDTPYAGKDMLARDVAHSVAEKAYPNFLVARLVVEDLLSRNVAVDPSAPGALSFPTKVPAAFSRYLARFGPQENMVRDLMLPLALAEGQGLPWDDIWTPLASALSPERSNGEQYSDDDIRWLLSHAGVFILESAEGGRSVYRLFHQALADTLLSGKDVDRLETTYAHVLSASVPQFGESEKAGKNWLLANRYVRSYLSTHAVKGGILSTFIEDPLFLMASDSKRLLGVFAESRKSYRQDIAAIYRDVAHWIATLPYPLAAGYLEMQGRKRGESELADRICSIPLDRSWAVPWARWSPPASSRSLANGIGEISSLGVDTLGDGRIVALVGRESGSVEIWNVTTGDTIALWNPPGVESVRELILAQVESHDVIVAAWADGELGTFDLVTEKEVINRPRQGTRDDALIKALCFATRRGQPVCITSHEADYLTVWELPNLTVMFDRCRAGAIYDLQLFEENGRSMLMGVGDSYGDSWELGEGVDWRQSSKHASTLHLFSLDDLSPIWEDASERVGLFYTVSRAEYLGHHLIAGYRAITDAIEIWDLGERRKLSHVEVRAGKCWLYSYQSNLLLAWEWNGEFLAAPLVPLTENARFALQVQRAGSPVKIQGDKFTTIVTIQNRMIVLSAALDEVRAWDFEDLLEECLTSKKSLRGSVDTVGETQNVNALGTSLRRPTEVYVGASDAVIALNLSDGCTQWKQNLKSGKRVQRITTVASRDELYVADGGSIYILDIASHGAVKRVIETGASLQTMEVLEWRGKLIAFATVGKERLWSVRAWDLDSGTELPTHRAYQLRGGQGDKALYGLAVHGGKDSIRIAFAGQYGKVMVTNFLGPTSRGYPYFQEWKIPYAGIEYTHSLVCGRNEEGVLLVAGTEKGHLVIWDFYSGEVRASRANAHLGGITSMGFAGTAGDERLLSTGVNGVVRIWTLKLEEVLSIDVGEYLSSATWVASNQFVVGGIAGTLTVKLVGHRVQHLDQKPG